MPREILFYIDGSWVLAKSGIRIDDIDPSTGECYAMAHMAGTEDVEDALCAALKAQPAWQSVLPGARERLLLKAADIMESRVDEFTEIMVAETGSAYSKARGEVMGGANIFRVAAGECRRLSTEFLQPDFSGQVSMAVRVPVGTVLGIMPFNYPLILSIKKIAYAIAAGNTFVAKSAPSTPSAGAIVAAVLDEAGLQAGVFNLLCTNDEDVIGQLIDDPRVNMITFTGSARVGKQIAARCGGLLKKCTIEAGGKNPLILLKDFEIDRAAKIAVFGAFSHQGQLCMATSRLIVESPVYEAFCDAMVAEASAVRVGSAHNRENHIGPLMNESHCAFVDAQIRDALEKGARLLTGGTHENRFYAPTVLADVTPAMRIFYEETFAPVTSIIRAENPEDALALCNDNEYGLAAAVLTHNLELAWKIGTRIEAGNVHINDTTYLSATVAPFGGVKSSGIGREGGHYSMEDYTELRWLSMQTTPRDVTL